MKPYLRKIDTNTTGNRYDVTPLFADYEAFNALVDDLVSRLGPAKVDLVACIDALGFILGTAIAQKLKAGILSVRKGGKLPVEADRVGFRDYTGQEKELEIRRDILGNGSRVLVVDEWIETGAQVAAAIKLIEARGGIVVGVAAVNIDRNPRTEALRAQYEVYSVWQDGA